MAIQNGAALAWGNNYYGQLGNGATANTLRAVTVAYMGSAVTSVAAGANHSLGVRLGNVFAWRANGYGQLGNGSTSFSNIIPTQVDPTHLKNIVAVAAGYYCSYALAGDGSLWVWGDNEFGQLGLGNTTNYATPQHLLPPSGYYYSTLNANNSGGHAVAILAAIYLPVVTLVKSGSAAFFSFPTQTGFAYQLQRSADLHTWADVTGQTVAGDNSTKFLSDTSSAPSTFWRLSIVRAAN